MYSNIPTSELTTILYEMCKKNDVEEKTTKDIMANFGIPNADGK